MVEIDFLQFWDAGKTTRKVVTASLSGEDLILGS
jgi:hypothetical protein